MAWPFPKLKPEELVPRDQLVTRMIELFRRADLTLEERTLCTAALLDGISALPLRDTLNYDDAGSLLVNGKSADVAMARAIRESARAVLGNLAYRTVHSHVTYLAIEHGIHKMTSESQILFSKAAIWYGAEERKALQLLAQMEAGDYESEDSATIA